MKHRTTAGLSVGAVVVAHLLWGISPTRAARPFITDDARIVEAQACQLEGSVIQVMLHS